MRWGISGWKGGKTWQSCNDWHPQETIKVNAVSLALV